jgi:hypothetical protein
MKKFNIIFILILLFSCTKETKKIEITAPKLTNNPSLDVICTNQKPLLSFFRSKGGFGKRLYTIQLDTNSNFNSQNLIEYKNIEELNEFLVEKRLDKPLIDKTRYYWRAKATDEKGYESPWSFSRFYIDTDDNKHFMNLIRVPITSVEVSTGQNPKNLIDYDDPGQVTFWTSAPPGPIKDWLTYSHD